MKCLHGKEAVVSENGLFWICGETNNNNCKLSCTEEDAFLYEKGIEKFLATFQKQPTCCNGNLAKLRMVKNPEKSSYGRPFFVCSKDKNPCKYFEWGDVYINDDRPQCHHGERSKLQVVKKESVNKGRSFFCCPEPQEKSCNFFMWYEPPTPATEAKGTPGAKGTRRLIKKKIGTYTKTKDSENGNDDDNDDEMTIESSQRSQLLQTTPGGPCTFGFYPQYYRRCDEQEEEPKKKKKKNYSYSYNYHDVDGDDES